MLGEQFYFDKAWFDVLDAYRAQRKETTFYRDLINERSLITQLALENGFGYKNNEVALVIVEPLRDEGNDPSSNGNPIYIKARERAWDTYARRWKIPL